MSIEYEVRIFYKEKRDCGRLFFENYLSAIEHYKELVNLRKNEMNVNIEEIRLIKRTTEIEVLGKYIDQRRKNES